MAGQSGSAGTRNSCCRRPAGWRRQELRQPPTVDRQPSLCSVEQFKHRGELGGRQRQMGESAGGSWAAELAGGAPLEQVQPAGATVMYMP